MWSFLSLVVDVLYYSLDNLLCDVPDLDVN
jgi:hypothetical protein